MPIESLGAITARGRDGLRISRSAKRGSLIVAEAHTSCCLTDDDACCTLNRQTITSGREIWLNDAAATRDRSSAECGNVPGRVLPPATMEDA